MKKKIYLRDNFVLEDIYAAIVQDRLNTVHIPHSDVFYVRKAIEHRTGILYSLEQIEAAMKAEGWRK
tara:strand:+ start:291 stop:491 length:201 start_codon:yes stop_codon:yes gene_type:complete